MTEKRKEYINLLLHELKAFETRVLAIKNEDTVPFSFFRDSFNKTQAIMRILHEMEALQVDDMKQQMERLVSFLSESKSRQEAEEKKVEEKTITEPVLVTESMPVEKEVTSEPVPTPSQPSYTEKIILPEYKNPKKRTASFPPPSETEIPEIETTVTDAVVKEEVAPARTLNDAIQVTPPVFDLKKGISLNDRFLFQRELFNNNKTLMDSTISQLNAFSSYADAEQFLKTTTTWDFENPTVISFLEIIKKKF